MKKIIAIVALTVGFSLTAAAQTKAKAATAKTETAGAVNVTKAAAADVKALDKAVGLTAEEKTSFQGLFETKYNTLADPGVSASEDRKGIIYKTIDAKLRATLSAAKMAKVDANPALLKQLTH